MADTYHYCADLFCHFSVMDLVFFSSVLWGVGDGSWIILVFSAFIFFVMFVWNYGSKLMYETEVKQKMSMDVIRKLGCNLGTLRAPGIGLLYSELVKGVPAIFGRFLTTLPAIHSTIIFVCIKYVPVPTVPRNERFLFRRVCPKSYHIFRCIARYGYKDTRKENHQTFEQLLMESLEKEIAFLRAAKECGIVYLLDNGDIRAKKESWFIKKLVINYFYAFLKNCRRGIATLSLTHSHLIQYPSALNSFDHIINRAKDKKIVIFLDYDGTLSPIVDDPDRAFMSADMHSAVKRVIEYFPTAIISGRSRDKVFEVAPSLHMVELRKTGGDTLEFHNFYKNFSSVLKDIVWTTEITWETPATPFAIFGHPR